MTYYMDETTGELLTKKEALKKWRDEYDGDDPTNFLTFSELFTKTDLVIEF